MKDLRDVADKVINLEEVFFPKDKTKCGHIALDDTFIPIKENGFLIGCIMKCSNCGHLSERKCEDGCAVGATYEAEDGQLITVLPCDLPENEKFVKGLKKHDYSAS